MGKPGKTGAASSSAGNGTATSSQQNADFDVLQQQLVELSEQGDGVAAIVDLTIETKKSKLSELSKLEQYTRRDNLRLFNFPLCEDSEPRDKFIALVAELGITISRQDINIIHKLTSSARSQSVIVRMNNRNLRNEILYAKKGPLNSAQSGFKGVFTQEDLTTRRSKLLKYVKGNDNVEKVQSRDGRLRVLLKEDCGAGTRIVIENPDDLFKMGIDDSDVTQFGFIDVYERVESSKILNQDSPDPSDLDIAHDYDAVFGEQSSGSTGSVPR